MSKYSQKEVDLILLEREIEDWQAERDYFEYKSYSRSKVKKGTYYAAFATIAVSFILMFCQAMIPAGIMLGLSVVEILVSMGFAYGEKVANDTVKSLDETNEILMKEKAILQQEIEIEKLYEKNVQENLAKEKQSQNTKAVPPTDKSQQITEQERE